MAETSGTNNTDAKNVRFVFTKIELILICVYLCVLLFLFGCDSEDHNETDPGYLDTWRLETPTQGTMSMTVDLNGQPEVVDTEGDVTVFLEFAEDGTTNIMYEFVSINPPFCSSQDPCNIHASSSKEILHQYIGKRLTSEGLEAFFVRIVNETSSDSTEGYIYLSEDRLCISNGLWDFMIIINDNTNTDPQAIDFDKCFARNV
jgi:hypothetical protein